MFDRSEALTLLALAKEGAPHARERLIQMARPFVVAVVSHYTRQRVDWHEDEVSMGLIAFNEAIDAYKGSGPSFFSFAHQVIRRRLIDHFRSQARFGSEVLRLDEVVPEGLEISPSEMSEAWDRYLRYEEALERAEEIEILRRDLEAFGITFQDLVKESPVHRATRARLHEAALQLVEDRTLFEALRATGRLPKKELCKSAGITPRVLERGRKYVIAIALILAGEEFQHLKGYVELEEA